jgi:large subunit ribosomal protein L17
MRHGIKTKKLNRTSAHRKALLKNLSLALLKHEQIKTTLPKAKALRPFVEKLITVAKKPTLAITRKLHATISEEGVVKKLLNDIAPRSMNRAGGYTRIYKMGFRYGDMAPMALIELVDKTEGTIQAKGPKEAKDKSAKVENKTPVAKTKAKVDPVSKPKAKIKAESAKAKSAPKPRKFKAAQ